ncbi:MAG: hypothetical protein GC162_19210 [Planctomycetes bacterium]|nr:hypothetical protein [Planctomycetota bacterium]
MARNKTRIVTALAATLMAAPSLFASAISINFTGGGANGTGTVTGTAGVAGVGNWNNVANASGSSIALNDSTGAASGASITTFTSNGVYATTVTNNGSSASLMKGYLDDTGTAGNTSVTVASIPYSSYIVVGYVGSDASGRTGSINIGGTTYFYSTLNNYPSNGFVRTTDTSGTNPSANYAVFTNQTASSFTLTNTRNSNNTGLHGLQIIDTSQGTGFGVNFIGGSSTAGNNNGVVNAYAGAGQYAQAYWNNVAPRGTNTGTIGAGSVLDRQGNALGSTTVSWSTTNTWGETQADTSVPANDDFALMKGYLDDSGSGSTVTVNSVGLAQYDVVVYVAGDQNTVGQVDGQYWLETTGGTVITNKSNIREGTNGSGTFAGVYQGGQATAATTSNAPTGNYVVFHGVTATDFVLRAAKTTGNRAPLNGFQVYQTNNPSIAINFVGGGNGTAGTPASMNVQEIAGVIGQSHWNQVANNGSTTTGGAQSGSSLDLVDSLGATTTADVSWTSGNTYNVTNGSTAGDNRMLAGYLDNHGTVNVSQIQYSYYDVYVYTDSDRPTNVSDTYKLTDALSNLFTAVSVEGTFDGILTQGRDYVVFHNITGSTFSLTSTQLSGNGAGPINGIQIVAVPTPAALPAGIALIGLVLMRRRK